MIIFAYLISFGLGYLTIISLVKKENPLCLSLTIPLSLTLGLGISVLLTFISFLVSGEFNPLLIIGLNITVLMILLFLNAPHLPKPQKISFNKHSFISLGFSLFWIALFCLIYFLSQKHPFGEWDAWALWNMKSKFLIFAGNDWTAIFNKLHWHTQPDYPLFLPFLHTWTYCFTQQDLIPIPRITAVALATLCPMLLYGGLKQFASTSIAVIATIILILNPFYMFLSTAQYSDILLGLYLLASIILFIVSLRTQNKNITFIFGLLLGLMTFIKNEGIVFMIILVGLLISYSIYEKFMTKRFSTSLIKNLLIGLLITISATIFFKTCLAPLNRDILANPATTEMTFLNIKGLIIIKNAFLYEFSHKRWCWIWLFLGVLFLSNPKKFLTKECKLITLFFISYFMIILYIYLSTINFDLSWRLKSTLHRILFYLLPSLLFFGFYSQWRKDES